MAKLRYFLAGCLCIGVFVFFFRDVTELDIVAANHFSMQSPAEPLKAGDIVVQDQSGGVSKICNAVLSPNNRDEDPRTGTYYNRIDRILASIMRAAVATSLINPDWASEFVKPKDRDFVGKRTGLKSVLYVYEDTEKCPCEIARAMARGARVCLVNATLLQTGEPILLDDGSIKIDPLSRALAVSLRANSAFVPEETFKMCGVAYNEAARNSQSDACESSNELSSDVKLRKLFNLIARERSEHLLATRDASIVK